MRMIERKTRTPIMHRTVLHGGVAYFGGLVADDQSASMKGQTEQVLAKLDKLLADVNSDKTKLLSATLFVTDLGLKAEMNEAWTSWIPAEHLPARATIGVSDLGAATTLIEVTAIAAVGS